MEMCDSESVTCGCLQSGERLERWMLRRQGGFALPFPLHYLLQRWGLFQVKERRPSLGSNLLASVSTRSRELGLPDRDAEGIFSEHGNSSENGFFSEALTL